MTTPDESSLREETKRDRAMSAEDRARCVADMTEWADAQQAVRRNTREFCLAHQRKLLRSMGNAPTR